MSLAHPVWLVLAIPLAAALWLWRPPGRTLLVMRIMADYPRRLSLIPLTIGHSVMMLSTLCDDRLIPPRSCYRNVIKLR